LILRILVLNLNLNLVRKKFILYSSENKNN